MRTTPTPASECSGRPSSCTAQRRLVCRRGEDELVLRRRDVEELLLRRVELPPRAPEVDFRPRPVLDLRPELDFFLRAGTLPPARRASDRPIAMACLRLLTFWPEPLFSVPRLRSRIARATFCLDFAPYRVAMRLYLARNVMRNVRMRRVPALSAEARLATGTRPHDAIGARQVQGNDRTEPLCAPVL